jgi:hypothetical protein
MASANLQWAAPKPLKLDGNVSENFRKFEEHWTLFEKTELKGRSEEERCSYFLLCIGEKGRKVHKTLTFATPETETNQEGVATWKRTTNELKSAFKTYCNPRKKHYVRTTQIQHTESSRKRKHRSVCDCFAHSRSNM